MDIDDYHTNSKVCRYCGEAHGAHRNICPDSMPDDWDDPVARGRKEDQVHEDLRERWTEGP